MKYQTGIALLPVALIITVIAAVSLLLSYESSMNVHQSASQNESKQADLIAEAGMAHAKWQLKKITDCAGYANLPSTNFDVHSYTANITPDNGSPISVSATGVSNTGITRTLIDTHMRMYQTPYTKEFVLDESGKDTFIEGESGHTDHNKGNDNHIVIKSETNKPERGLIQFDLTKIPSNTKILNAILELHLSDSKGSSQDIFIHRVTDDWVEEEVTWEIKRSGFFQNWSPQGGEYVAQVSGLFSADSVGWKSAEITQLVQDWVKAPSINNGMILLSMPASGNNEKIFTSSDQGDVALHPKLTITYACECGQQCLDPAVSKLLLIVSDPNNLDPQEEARQSLFESWGYGVALIDDSKSQEDLEDAAALNNVIYVSEEIDHDQLRDKLRGVPIGIVNEEQYLFQEFGFSNDRSIKFRDQIDIVDNSHYITSTFPQGLLTVYTSEQPSSMVITPASGVRVLGLLNNSGPGWEPSLAVIDTGGELYGGGVAPARRVKLPWANIDVSTLNEDGQTLTRRAIEWAAGAEGEDNNTGLIAHWKLDETTGLVAKESINGFDGVLENNPEWEPSGRIEGALFFDNVNAQVVVPHNDQLSPTKAITMSAWIYNDAAALFDSYRIISKESLGSNDNYFLSLGSNQLYMGIGGEFFMPGVDFQTDIWYHVAGTYDDDADEIRMYIDGIEVLVESTSVQLVANNDSIYIGSNWEEYKWWEGLLDDVRLYNRALTATEIEEVFNTAPSEGSDDGGGSKAIPDPPSDTCSGNYLDEFNINDSYAGNDGSLTWANDWQEVNESDGAKSGDEQVTTDGSNIYILQIRDNDGGGEGVEREADLSDYLNATLNFDYRRKGLDNSDDYVMIELSFNGNLWTEIDRITGPGTDTSYQTFSKDISSFISTNTKFRFRTSSKNGGTDTVFFDNVQIGVSGCVE